MDFFGVLRRAARALIKTPGFALAAILTLAVGIGANVAIFSLINGLLLRPLPFPGSDRLVSVIQRHPKGGTRSTSPSKYLFWSEHATRSFTGIAAYDQIGSGLNLSTGGNPERVITSKVSANFFAVLGSSMAAGRGFVPGEDRPGAGFPTSAEIWTPADLDPSANDRTGMFRCVGRVRPGEAIASAQAEMDVVWRQHFAIDAEDGLNKGRVTVVPRCRGHCSCGWPWLARRPVSVRASRSDGCSPANCTASARRTGWSSRSAPRC